MLQSVFQELIAPHSPRADPPAREPVAKLLIQTTARVMLEFNVRSAVLAGHVRRLGRALGLGVDCVVSYRSLTLSFDDSTAAAIAQVPEYRLNVAVASHANRIVDDVCTGRSTAADALAEMQSLSPAPVHPRWALAAMFALAASALACILHADLGSILVSGISSALGLLARQALGRRHAPLFSLPFAAGLIAGLLGSLAVRWGWTQTTGLCLIVPALMLVPGPHFINGVADIFENQIVPGTARLVLAAGIMLAAALGVASGAWVLGGLDGVSGATSDGYTLTLLLDVVLAGLAACGFGAFYNAPWRLLWVSIACGMIGHGVRFVCLADGLGLPAATFAACAVIGVMAHVAFNRLHAPFSSIAFAGAVPMMPGTLIYRGIAGAVRLVQAGPASADPADATATLVLLLQAGFVIAAMAAGLSAGALAMSVVRRAVVATAGRSAPQGGPLPARV